jgi:hypothetical protein
MTTEARIGLIIPSGNRLTEPQFHAYAPPEVGIHVTRLRMTGRFRKSPSELKPALVSLDLVDELARLEPCGHGNPAPAFLMRDVVIHNPRRSRDQTHLLFNVEGTPPLRAVSFGGGDRLAELKTLDRLDVAVSLRPNTWRGQKSVTLEVIDFRPSSQSRR